MHESTACISGGLCSDNRHDIIRKIHMDRVGISRQMLGLNIENGRGLMKKYSREKMYSMCS